MSLKAVDVMTDKVLSVDPDASLFEVQRLFVEEGIHGAPVINDEQRAVGVITSSDLLRAASDELEAPASTEVYLRDLLEFYSSFSSGDGELELSDLRERLSHMTVADVMTPEVVSVSRDAPLAEVARCLRENRIHRVWVVEKDSRVCGVISTFDLLPVIEGQDG
jgi:CBS domain-containing protein